MARGIKSLLRSEDTVKRARERVERQVREFKEHARENLGVSDDEISTTPPSSYVGHLKILPASPSQEKFGFIKGNRKYIYKKDCRELHNKADKVRKDVGL